MRSPEIKRNFGARVSSLFSNGMGCETTSQNEVGIQVSKIRKGLASPASKLQFARGLIQHSYSQESLNNEPKGIKCFKKNKIDKLLITDEATTPIGSAHKQISQIRYADSNIKALILQDKEK